MAQNQPLVKMFYSLLSSSLLRRHSFGSSRNLFSHHHHHSCRGPCPHSANTKDRLCFLSCANTIASSNEIPDSFKSLETASRHRMRCLPRRRRWEGNFVAREVNESLGEKEQKSSIFSNFRTSCALRKKTTAMQKKYSFKTVLYVLRSSGPAGLSDTSGLGN